LNQAVQLNQTGEGRGFKGDKIPADTTLVFLLRKRLVSWVLAAFRKVALARASQTWLHQFWPSWEPLAQLSGFPCIKTWASKAHTNPV